MRDGQTLAALRTTTGPILTLLGLAAIPGFFLLCGAFAPALGHGLTRAELSYHPRPTSNSGERPDCESLVTKYASAYGVRPEIVHAVIQRESNGDPLAVGPAGEQGLMQLMPKTAQALGVRNRFDIEENIRGGVEYLSQLLKQFGDEKKALAAYHTGPGTVWRKGITPRGHAYASDILTNAKKRSLTPAQVVGGFDTRTGARVPGPPRAGEADPVTRAMPPGVKWALATSGGAQHEGLVPPPAPDSLLRLPVEGTRQVVKGMVGAAGAPDRPRDPGQPAPGRE